MSSPPLHGVVRYWDEKCASEQIWDDRHFPIMTIHTNGVPEVDLQHRMYSMRDPLIEYAKKHGLHTVVISDLSRLKTPDAITRKKLSELAKEKDLPFKGTHLATVFVVTNPLMRGIVTAVSWVAGDAMVPNIYTSNIDGAIKEMRRIYAEAGTEMPHFPGEYEFAAATAPAA